MPAQGTVNDLTSPQQQQPAAEMQSVIRAVTPEAIALCRAPSNAAPRSAASPVLLLRASELCV